MLDTNSSNTRSQPVSNVQPRVARQSSQQTSTASAAVPVVDPKAVLMMQLATAVQALATNQRPVVVGPTSKDPIEVKKDMIKQMVIPNYSKDNGVTFVNNIKRQLRLYKIEPDDPDIGGLLMGKIIQKLTSDMQAACSASSQ